MTTRGPTKVKRILTAQALRAAIFEPKKRGARPELQGWRAVLVPTWYLLPPSNELDLSREDRELIRSAIEEGHMMLLEKETSRAHFEAKLLLEPDADGCETEAAYRELSDDC